MLCAILTPEPVIVTRGWQCSARPGVNHTPMPTAPGKSWRWGPRKGGLILGDELRNLDYSVKSRELGDPRGGTSAAPAFFQPQDGEYWCFSQFV